MNRDSAMCSHPNCPLRSSCYRHSASGRVAADWQVYAEFQPQEPLDDPQCEGFIEAYRSDAAAIKDGS